MDWIIGIGGSNADGVKILLFSGTLAEAKEKLIELLKNERKVSESDFDFGTDDVNDIEVRCNGSLYGYSCYSDYHTDIEFVPMAVVQRLK